MTIRYSNGQTYEAVLLSRTETTIRAAIQGHEDVVILNLFDGVWVSDEQVQDHNVFMALDGCADGRFGPGKQDRFVGLAVGISDGHKGARFENSSCAVLPHAASHCGSRNL